MADNFFNEEQQEETQEEQKVKVGEKEYSQDELNKLVNLGEIAVEAEEKYNRPISKFWPEYTKSQQELERVRSENDELKKSAKPQVAPSDEEQVTKQVKDELGKLGYAPMEVIEQRAREISQSVMAGYRILDKVTEIVNKNAEIGNPQTTAEDLLEFMNNPDNPSDPEKAYKIMFEKELDTIKEKKLASLKPSGLITEPTSTAGSKRPEPVKITKSNLGNVLDEYLSPRNA